MPGKSIATDEDGTAMLVYDKDGNPFTVVYVPFNPQDSSPSMDLDLQSLPIMGDYLHFGNAVCGVTIIQGILITSLVEVVQPRRQPTRTVLVLGNEVRLVTILVTRNRNGSNLSLFQSVVDIVVDNLVYISKGSHVHRPWHICLS